MAFIQIADGRLWLCMTPGELAREVEWTFPFVSAARWCAERGAVLATATPPGGRKPSVRANKHGDLSFYSWAPGDGKWRLVYGGYADDPICLAGEGWAVNGGTGLTYLDEAGQKTREAKAGRFSWGPPSLSARPSGDIVAWIRWRGDDRRLFLDDRSGQLAADQRTSVHRYAWVDNETIAYYLGAGLRLLNIRTGKSRRLAPSLRALIGDTPGLPVRAARYLEMPEASVDAKPGEIQMVDERLWFTLRIFSVRFGTPRYIGLFARDLTTGAVELITDVEPEEVIESFTALPDGTTVLRIAHYDGTRVVGRERRALGPLASFVGDGWNPLRGCCDPEFGFHALP